MGASHTHTQGDPHLAPAPTTQLGDEKLQVDLGSDGNGEKKFRVVPNPPDLEAWRQKLFDVDEMITLSEEEYVCPALLPLLLLPLPSLFLLFHCPSHLPFFRFVERLTDVRRTQVLHILSTRRQRILAPLDAEIQTQALCVTLLGL